MALKRLEGRDEPVLDPEMPIIDAHHHLFDVPGVRYLFDDYLSDVRAGHNIVASVYVETRAFARKEGPEVLRPLGEIEFANGAGAMGASGLYGPCRIAAAIVGYADLRLGSAIGDLLDQSMALAPDRFRGIRQVTVDHPSEAAFRHVMAHRPPQGVLRHPNFRAGFREIAARGLTFDAAVYSVQLPDISALADFSPNTAIVLNHTGMVMNLEMDASQRTEAFIQWRAGMRDLARRPNVVCKISGLGMPFWGFGFETRTDPIGYIELAEAWRPYVETAIEAFGIDRCMLASNFPPDGRSCGYVPLWNAYKHVVRGASAREKSALFHRTAMSVYGIEVPAIADTRGAKT
jgi:L-fuconolactonase